MKRDKTEILCQAFPGLSGEHLVELAGAATLHTYPPGTVLCREGCVEDTFYIIAEGLVEITKQFEGDVQRVLQHPGAGEFFGEIALIHDCSRTATVCTLETTTVLEIGRGTFVDVLERSAAMAVRIMQQVTSRLRDADQAAIVDLRRSNVELAQALREARAEAGRNHAILEGIADGVIVSDLDGKIMVVNDTIAHFVGRSVAEIVGCDIKTLLDDVGAQTREKVLSFLASPGKHSLWFRWRDRMLSASVAPVRLVSGEELGTVIVLRDVTREVEAQRAKESLFAVAAHELRTPLNAIINYANIMWAGLIPPDHLPSTARRIAVNGERLLLLVNNLLEQAKMEAGQAQLRIKQFVPSELVGEACDMMDVLVREKGLELSSHISDDVPAEVRSDRNRLFQVLINLISNAVKFTEEGTVRVRVTLPDADHWALEVSDTGSGIPAEARNRIFEPFELAEDPATRKHAGAGLGLSIVKQMVELMGGEITLESEVGQGSTFTVVLPLTPPQEEKP
jgi:PAS domain S-box-containing protein